MGYLIDTNIWSEMQKGARTNPGVKRWFATVTGEDLFLSVLVIGEVRRGIECLRRRDPEQATQLEQRLSQLKTAMNGRILTVSPAIAERWGKMNAPDPLPVIDGLLAATALEHNLILVTRNVRDIERSGVRWLNPFALV